LPVVRLARLGVDQRVQGHGIGKVLLRHVLSVAVDQRDSVGCVGVVTDAKPDAIAFYENLGFERLAVIGEGLLHGDPTPMFVPIESVVATLKG
jgi:GNAT superfamily N-acetyltransferase